MASFNKWIGMGNLTRDAEIKQTTGGQSVCSFGLAVNEKYTAKSGEMKENTLFVDVDCWGKVAENCAKYLHKGSAVLVDGKLKLDTWEKDGNKRSKISVTAQNVQFLSSAKIADDVPQSTADNDKADTDGLGDDNGLPF